ncbi:DUF707 domain-containing protein [Pseudovibrio japonicus]|uniref:DUF707 domain-containing protein n=1 Tax=Pseudovibrio japonicus TaxID=366534 RepID=UPI00188B2276|nr:DUF707 domain-containing protein [Pseudovibrio japonicus]
MFNSITVVRADRVKQMGGLTEASSGALVVSTYRTPDTSGGTAFPHHFVGGKWTGIFSFFRTYPEVLNKYEYFWFPDDDIQTTPEDADRFLEIVKREGFQLAQPALEPDSYYAHRITLANPLLSFRRTNFVELMMPILHRDLLLKVLPLFEGRHFAQGLDYMWHQLSRNPERDVAIIDETPMGHRRPRQVCLKGNMSKMQVDMMSEREATFRELNICRQAPVVISAKTKDGIELQRSSRLTVKLLMGMWSCRAKITRQPWSANDYFRMLGQQALGRTNTTTSSYVQPTSVCRAR